VKYVLFYDAAADMDRAREVIPAHRAKWQEPTTQQRAAPHTTNQLYGFPDIIRVFHDQNPESLDPLPSGAPGRVETPVPARRRRELGGGGW